MDSPFKVLLPGATGGNAPYTYTISGLPETLSFNPDTRWISGTPTASGLHQVTFTATDRDLDPVSQTFELNIAADNMPTEPSVDDLHLKVARAFNLELPAGANGDPPYTYTGFGTALWSGFRRPNALHFRNARHARYDQCHLHGHRR